MTDPFGPLPRSIAITGATGLLGTALCGHFSRQGCEVRALSRRPPAGSLDSSPAAGSGGRIRHFPCDLPDRIEPAALEGAEAVIHAAYSMRSRSREVDRRVNLDGTRKLVDLVRKAGVGRYVFVSSVSAHPEAEGFYGRSKLVLEGELDAGRDTIIRPGLILSTGAGLFVRMMNTVKKSGIAPMFGGGRQRLQTVHLDDLVAGFERALRLEAAGTHVLCEPDGLTMRDLFKLLGRLLDRRVVIVPLPFGPALAALRAAEAMGLKLPVSSDNLLGLRSLRPADSRPSLERLGLTIRTAEESLRALLRGG